MRHRHVKIGEITFDIVNITFFLLFTIICIFPFYYIFINTISNNHLSSVGKILFFPRGIQFHNYVEIFKIPGLAHAAYISVARTVLGTSLSLISCSFLGYAFSKSEFWMRKFWYRFVVVTLYFNAGIIPWFVTLKELGMVNNFLVYILPFAVNGFYVILFKTYVEQLPVSLEESAQIDGAGYLVRFTKIILPLSKPILATIAVFESVQQWNSFIETVFLIKTPNLYTLQFLLYQYLNQVNNLAQMLQSSPSQAQYINPSQLLTPTSIRMTISIIVVLPILFVYPFMQRYFVKGIMVGSIKG